MEGGVDMYLDHIVQSDRVPFQKSTPPASIYADAMTTETLHRELMAGYGDMQAGRVHDAAAFFEAFRQTHA